MSWAYVPDTAASSSDYSSRPVVRLWASATWRGKHSGPRAWRLRWKRVDWLRRLSGLTLLTSTAARCVESWIASLRASRASPGPSPGSSEAKTTSGGSGPTSHGCFAKYDQDSSCWRTSQRSLLEEVSDEYSGRWPSSGTMRNGTCSERLAWARRTNGRGFSSSGGEYPTPTALDYGSNQGGAAGRSGAKRPGLDTMARQWPTPKASRRGDCSSERERRSPDLVSVAVSWPTPTTAPDSLNTGGNQKSPASLTFQARKVNVLAERRGRQGRLMKLAGVPTYQPADLNPRFVEALMGVPGGWVSATCSAAEWSRWWRLMRSELSRLGR